MVEADASSAAIARGGAPAPAVDPGDASVVPFRAGERWVGSYVCRQGSTDMTIAFEEVRRAARSKDDVFDVEAVLEFRFDGNGPLGHAAVEGAARMSGKYDAKTRRLRLVGEEWLEQPPGYALVNLVGAVSQAASPSLPMTYVGTVEGPGCSSFSARPEGALAP
ncbi:MAG: hypothetical protein KF894_11565 [Labilithrix sp.]|nr:hypothetical protein [Labilithrix sp.]